MIVLLMVSLFVVLMSISCASAASTVYVNTTGNDTTGNGSAENPFFTIHKGVDNATDGDTIIIAIGQYSGTGNTNLTLNKNMTLIGESRSGTIINGNGTNGIFRIASGVNVTIYNLTFTNSMTADEEQIGGAISNYGNLQVTDCIFINNHGYWGGAIYNERGTLNVTNCTFTGNTGPWGGAIRNNWGNIAVTGSTFQNNSASENGGAINNDGGYAAVKGCTFTGNHANNGGAIGNWMATMDAHFNRFYGNNATYGNDIYNMSSYLNIEDNWWGSNNPSFASLLFGVPYPTNWLYMTINATPTTINNTETSLITVSFNNRFDGTTVTPFDFNDGHIPDGTPVDFSLVGALHGTLNALSTLTVNGTASVSFKATSAGVQFINATTDNQNITTNVTINPTPTKTFTLSVKNTGNGRIKAVYYVTVYRPDNAAPIFKKYVFYLNPGKSISFNIGTYAWETAISTDEMVYNYAYSKRTVSLVNTWTATGLAPYVQNYVVAKVPASRSKGTIARARFWINKASLGVQIAVPPKLM